MCLDCFFCQNCVFVYEESMTTWFQSFLKTMSSYFWVTPLHELCLCCRVAEKLISFSLLNQKEEAWTLESLSVSFTQWQLIIFHLPGAVGYVFGQKSIFFKHTLLSFKISMINPKNVLLFVSLFLLHQLFNTLTLLTEKSTRFYFQSKDISNCFFLVSRIICFDSR